MTNNPLARWEKARTEIEAARSVDEVKAIRDKAEALRLYVKQAGEGIDAQNAVAEIKIRAERRAGQLLKGMEKAKGGQPSSEKKRSHDERTTLSDLGIDHNQSSRWQTMAGLPDKKFDAHIDKAKTGKKELTSAGVLREAKTERRITEKRDTLTNTPTPPPQPCAATVTRGDCIEVMETHADGSVNLIFADPPYNIGIDYGDGKADDSLDEGDYLEWCEHWIQECVRLLADDGSMWVMIGDEYADHYGVILRRCGLTRRSWVKWKAPAALAAV